MMRKIFGWVVLLLGILFVVLVGRYFWLPANEWLGISFGEEIEVPPSPVPDALDEYTFDSLAMKDYQPGEVALGRSLADKEATTSAYQFWYRTGDKRVSGRLDLPTNPGIYPVVILVRGYAEKEGYFSGSGTYRVAQFLAENSFITLAPDFLGFGASDDEDKDILINRFRRPETVLYLLASLERVNDALAASGKGEYQLDPERLFLWGHSNGGQIILSVLEITGRSIPTSLWAPVGKSFPESVLQYADEMDDNGRIVIERIDKFLAGHDPNDYSIATYWQKIKAPIQIQQGGWDDYISVADSQLLRDNLEEAGVTVTYRFYPGADHNLKQVWDEAVVNDVVFFNQWR